MSLRRFDRTMRVASTEHRFEPVHDMVKLPTAGPRETFHELFRRRCDEALGIALEPGAVYFDLAFFAVEDSAKRRTGLRFLQHLQPQPVAGEPWTTPPHEPTQKGERLYARGSADDMGGWVSHLASIESWLAATGELPCNVKLLIEGEESSARLIAIDDVNVRIEIDINGDGTTDEAIDTTWVALTS